MNDAVARWEAFTEDEREVSHFAFTSAAKRIMDDAAADRIPADTLNSAAGTFLHLSNLSRQLDLVAGRPTENLDSAAIVAQLIASGQTPEAVQYAAGAEEADEFTAAGCCPEEDGYLRAKSMTKPNHQGGM